MASKGNSSNSDEEVCDSNLEDDDLSFDDLREILEIMHVKNKKLYKEKKQFRNDHASLLEQKESLDSILAAKIEENRCPKDLVMKNELSLNT